MDVRSQIDKEIAEKQRQMDALRQEIASLREARKVLKGGKGTRQPRTRKGQKHQQYAKPSREVVYEALKLYEKQESMYPTSRELAKFIRKHGYAKMPIGTVGAALNKLYNDGLIGRLEKDEGRGYHYSISG